MFLLLTYKKNFKQKIEKVDSVNILRNLLFLVNIKTPLQMTTKTLDNFLAGNIPLYIRFPNSGWKIAYPHQSMAFRQFIHERDAQTDINPMEFTQTIQVPHPDGGIFKATFSQKSSEIYAYVSQNEQTVLLSFQIDENFHNAVYNSAKCIAHFSIIGENTIGIQAASAGWCERVFDIDWDTLPILQKTNVPQEYHKYFVFL